jgi:hypothetical protein
LKSTAEATSFAIKKSERRLGLSQQLRHESAVNAKRAESQQLRQLDDIRRNPAQLFAHELVRVKAAQSSNTCDAIGQTSVRRLWRVTRIKAAAASALAQSVLTTTEFFRLGFGFFAAQY